jgi:hypothetical protein
MVGKPVLNGNRFNGPKPIPHFHGLNEQTCSSAYHLLCFNERDVSGISWLKQKGLPSGRPFDCDCPDFNPAAVAIEADGIRPSKRAHAVCPYNCADSDAERIRKNICAAA